MNPTLQKVLICACILAVVFGVSTFAADENDLGKWSASAPSYVPFPVYRVVSSADNRFAAIDVDEHPEKHSPTMPPSADQQTLYFVDLKTGDHRRLGPRVDTVLSSPEGHRFIYIKDFGATGEEIRLFEGLEPVRTFQVAGHFDAWWNPFTNAVMFEAGWPGDQEGFNKLGILDLATARVSGVPLRAVTELMGMCRMTGHFYTEHYNSDSQKYGADEYDCHGNFVRSMEKPLAFFSARCSYALPFFAESRHGPEDWAVYEAASGKQLMNFPWDESGKVDAHLFPVWNPRHDELLLVYTEHAATNTETIDVVDVHKRQVIKSWPTGNVALAVWAGDGQSVLIVRNNRLMFEPI